MSESLVTIYIPTKNRSDFLSRAVKSCLGQTYQHFEIIIVDDGSDAKHFDAVSKLSKCDGRITLIKNDMSLGASASRNKAIFAAKGQYITGLDDDDEFTSCRLSTFMAQAGLLEQHALLCSGYKINDEDGASYSAKSKEVDLQELLFANYIGCQVFTLTERLKSINGFDSQLLSCQDYDMWIRLVQRYGSALRFRNTSYILHQDHEMGRISNSPNVSLGYTAFLQKHRNLMNNNQILCQKLNFEVLHGSLPFIQVLKLPLAQQWRFLKIFLFQWVSSQKKGTGS